MALAFPIPEPAPVKEETSCCGGSEPEKTDVQVASDYHDTMSDLLDEFDVNEYAASVKIFALKPE